MLTLLHCLVLGVRHNAYFCAYVKFFLITWFGIWAETYSWRWNVVSAIQANAMRTARITCFQRASSSYRLAITFISSLSA